MSRIAAVKPSTRARACSRTSIFAPASVGRFFDTWSGMRRRSKRMASVPAASQCGTAAGVSWSATEPRPLRSIPSELALAQVRNGRRPMESTDPASSARARSSALSPSRPMTCGASRLSRSMSTGCSPEAMTFSW